MTDVFIIGEKLNSCFIVLHKDDNITYIMKNAITRIIPKKVTSS